MTKTTYYEKPRKIKKLSREEQVDLMFDLINAFRIVKTPLESAFLLQDLLTASEVKNLSKRLRIAKLLLKGKTQREICDELHCSFATITKVRMWLERGGEGLKLVINKLPRKYKLPKRLPPGPIEFHLPQALLALAQYTLTKKQEKRLKKFADTVASKDVFDKSLQEAFDEYYRSKEKGK